eukprot:6483353-Amphidinium_carterae.1
MATSVMSIMMLACSTGVAALRPSDMTAELAVENESAQPLDKLLGRNDALLQGHVKARVVDVEAAKQDINEIFLVVQQQSHESLDGPDTEALESSGLLANDGEFMQNLAIVEEIWIDISAHVKDDHHSKQRVTRALGELRYMLESWQLQMGEMADLSVPSDTTAVEAYTKKYQTVMRAFMWAFSCCKVEEAVDKVNADIAEKELRAGEGRPILFVPQHLNSFLPPLEELKYYRHYFLRLAQRYKQNLELAEKKGTQIYASVSQAQKHLKAVISWPSLVEKVLLERRTAVVSHFDIIESGDEPLKGIMVTKMMEDDTLWHGSPKLAKTANIFQTYMDVNRFPYDPDAGLAHRHTQAQSLLANVMYEAMKEVENTRTGEVFKFKFAIPEAWDSLYAV